MATKTKRPAAHRSTGVKAGVSSGKALKSKSHHKPGSMAKSGRSGAVSKDKVIHSKSATKLLMPVDEKHVAAVHNFELGLQQEQRQNYRKAREIFEKLVVTAPPDVADRVRVHLRACIDRLGATGPAPKTAGDYHVLGVAELNVRNLDRALEHLHRAHKLEPEREEIRYALAAAYALKGDRDAALEHLRVAIVLRPQNRFQARHDPDFQPIAGDDRFQAIVSHNGSL